MVFLYELDARVDSGVIFSGCVFCLIDIVTGDEVGEKKEPSHIPILKSLKAQSNGNNIHLLKRGGRRDERRGRRQEKGGRREEGGGRREERRERLLPSILTSFQILPRSS